jgi:AraC-like DNA-binding protein
MLFPLAPVAPESTMETLSPEPWTSAQTISGTPLRTIPAAPWYGSRKPVALRRRVDWALILGSDTPEPAMLESKVPEELSALIAAFDELLLLDDVDAMLRGAVQIALERIGLMRVGLFLLDAPRNLMLGTWGTDLDGQLVDEHHVMYDLGENDKECFRRAAQGIPFTVIDNCPIVVQQPNETRVVGRGWVACTPIRSARAAMGMLFNDTGLSGEPPDPAQQARTAVLCSLLGTVLDLTHGQAVQRGTRTPAGHPLVRQTVRLLAKDPSLGGKDLAATLDISLSRLARVFKVEMGMSLVEYRNRLRLERFQVLLDAGGENLLAAALAAGFGSYAQFHRVFRALRGTTPRAHLRERGHWARRHPPRG